MNRKTTFWLIVTGSPVLLALCMLLGPSGFGVPDWRTERTIFMLRRDRVLTGFIIGASLSCAGTVFQAVLRNPLAEPYVLGVSSGAALGAAVAILTGIAALGMFAVPITAFAFAATTLAIVYLLANQDGSPSIYGLILSGVIISSVCSSLLMYLVSVAPIEGLHSIMWWMLGNLEVTSRPLLVTAGAVCVTGCLAVAFMAPELNALTLGQEIAHHIGVRTRVAIVLALVLATLITAAAVGMAGLIGFVGLIVPHAMRNLVGPDHRKLIPSAALAGGAFLAVCDGLGRTLSAPIEIPVGVVTALVGGPFFLFLLRQRRRQGWIG
jgi:iron complex transport system permease protein